MTIDDQNPSNWRGMFEPNRNTGRGPGRDGVSAPPPSQPEREELPVDDGLDIDMTDYKPWVLQRGRGRPAMMLHLRRFDPKSGLWIGWQLAYPHLIAAEYVGDKMLSLDFGTRQFMIEGTGLGELARHLQNGSVLTVQEYSDKAWATCGDGGFIGSITRVGQYSESSR
jgi:hypothetical protein